MTMTMTTELKRFPLKKLPAILRLFTRNIQYVSYTNWRYGVIKNGGSMVRWNGFLVAYIYAIVNKDHEFVLVCCEGIFAKYLKDNMIQALNEALSDFDKDDYIRGWNTIDSPIK